MVSTSYYFPWQLGLRVIGHNRKVVKSQVLSQPTWLDTVPLLKFETYMTLKVCLTALQTLLCNLECIYQVV